MKITFYGTRGSTPTPDPDFLQFGGNTSCILLTFDSGRIAILDAGTGIRKLGDDLIAASHEQYDNIFIGLSHTHWDHIQGFPFFEPAYDPKRRITIAICGKDRGAKDLESIFSTQMQLDFFPVPLDQMGATLNFWQPQTINYTTSDGVKIVASRHSHPGFAYGYRIEDGGKTLVYCTDVEHIDGIDPNVVALSKNADLLIHDAHYTPEELKTRKGWGHSSWEQAIEVAKRAGVKKLALFHHAPEHTDEFLLHLEIKCKKRFPDAFLAREGLEIKL